MWRLILVCGLTLDIAAGVRAETPVADGRPSHLARPLPTALRPYVELVGQCEAYGRLVSATVWKTLYDEGFSPTSKQTWWVVADNANRPGGNNPGNAPANAAPRPKPTDETAAAPRLDSFAQEGFREILLFDARTLPTGRLAFGPKVSGDFAVEFVGKMVGDRTCDLSIICDGTARTGPAFQFGTRNNSKNFLWPGSTKDPRNGRVVSRPVELPSGTLIERGRWHRVRMEVKDGTVSGWVDGKCLGRAPLAEGYDSSRLRQPMILTSATVIGIDEARVEQAMPAPDRPTPAAAWGMAFGSAGRQEVEQKLAALVECLADEDGAVRDGAEALLRRAGQVAAGPLRAVPSNAPAEEVLRAQKLLDVLRPVEAAAPGT